MPSRQRTTPRPPSREESGPTPRLAIVRGAERGTVFPLVLKETLIGRIDSNHLAIDDKSVSRVHAKIVLQPGGVFIYDLDSMAGTQVNGSDVTRAKLKNGDEITIGEIALVYSE